MRLVLLIGTLLGGAALLLFAAADGRLGSPDGPGTITVVERVPVAAELAQNPYSQQAVRAALRQPTDAMIRFGDPRVYTTFSDQAFLLSLDEFGGQGPATLGDACDYARFCSAIDFWAATDHVATLTERRWRQTRETALQCQAVANADQAGAHDVFVGFSWPTTTDAQLNRSRAIVLSDLDTDVRLSRDGVKNAPAAVAGYASRFRERTELLLRAPARRTLDYAAQSRETQRTFNCTPGSPDCTDVSVAADAVLADYTARAIPHWSVVVDNARGDFLRHEADDLAPLGANELFEIYSGYGSAEAFRGFRQSASDESGQTQCPTPNNRFTPMCFRAGELIAARCAADGGDDAFCETRASRARQRFLQAPRGGHRLLTDEPATAWRDAGQCRDCFLPSFHYRPLGSAQHRLAVREFDSNGAPIRRYLGFTATSASHRARPGSGYKERDRFLNTDAIRTRDQALFQLIFGGTSRYARDIEDNTFYPLWPLDPDAQPRANVEHERAQSYRYSGGLTAVHAADDSRAALLDALARREVYATSGDRILLWFSIDNVGPRPRPMGARVSADYAPRFHVSAAGALKQLPGCPDATEDLVGRQRLARLCRNECFHPAEERKLISRIEVVRIRPQTSPDESIENLIDDPWLTHVCEPEPLGCRFEFSDPDYVSGARDVTYYVRAIESPSLAINGAGLRCEFDADGNCVATTPCTGDTSNPDCLAPVEERAWSSPIYVEWPR
ncbi:MAG: DUF3604 domain-containing protein [Pseudomonadota bacterium]